MVQLPEMPTKFRSSPSNESAQLTIALGEYDTGWHNPEQSLKRAGDIATQARTAGAQLLVLPEMCASGFTMDAKEFAEPEDGPSAKSLSRMAVENQLWIVAGLAMRRGKKYVNSALTFAPDGSLAARYDKQKLFGYAKETEVYSPGSGPSVAKIGGRDGLTYTGGSVIYDPWGERCDKPAKGSTLRTGVVTSGVVGRVRRAFPLTADNR